MYSSLFTLHFNLTDEVPETSEPTVSSDDSTPVILEPLPESLVIHDDEYVELSCRIKNVTPSDVSWTKNDITARKGKRFKVRVAILPEINKGC